MGQRGNWRTIDNLFLGTICFSFAFHDPPGSAFFSLDIGFSGSEDIFLEGKRCRRQVNLGENIGRTYLPDYMSRAEFGLQGVAQSLFWRAVRIVHDSDVMDADCSW